MRGDGIFPSTISEASEIPARRGYLTTQRQRLISFRKRSGTRHLNPGSLVDWNVGAVSLDHRNLGGQVTTMSTT